MSHKIVIKVSARAVLSSELLNEGGFSSKFTCMVVGRVQFLKGCWLLQLLFIWATTIWQVSSLGASEREGALHGAKSLYNLIYEVTFNHLDCILVVKSESPSHSGDEIAQKIIIAGSRDHWGSFWRLPATGILHSITQYYPTPSSLPLPLIFSHI